MTRAVLTGVVLLGAWFLLTAAAGEVPRGGKAVPAGPRAREEGKEVKVLARGPWPHVPVYQQTALPRKQQQWALRSAEELIALAGPHAAEVVARALKVERVDFKKQMLLVVADGTQPLVGFSGGGPPSAPNRVEIVRIEARDKGLIVTWRRAPRAKEGPVLTHPLAVALVPRSKGEVRFEQAPARPEGGGAPKGAGGKEVKALAGALFPDGWKAEVPPRQWVIRNYADLVDPRIKAPEEVIERMRKAQAERYARALKVPAIDFEAHMVLGVSGGAQKNDGYRVEVTRVVKADKGMVVHWRLRAPPPASKARPVLTHPAEVVLVERFTGPVQFERGPARKD